MSKTTKKKHVTREVLNDLTLPEDKQEIVKVIASRGNNLHEVLTSSGDKYLVSMPSKYRKSIWIKRGDYLIVSPIEEGDKVRAEITSILLKDQIKYIREEGKWPSAFDETNNHSNNGSNNDSNNGSNDLNSDKLFRNTNRPNFDCLSESSDSTTDSENEEFVSHQQND